MVWKSHRVWEDVWTICLSVLHMWMKGHILFPAKKWNLNLMNNKGAISHLQWWLHVLNGWTTISITNPKLRNNLLLQSATSLMHQTKVNVAWVWAWIHNYTTGIATNSAHSAATVNQKILAAIKFGVSQNKVTWRLLNLAFPPSMQCTINVIYICWCNKY